MTQVRDGFSLAHRAALMVAGARFRDLRPMGEGKHARFSVHSQGTRTRAVAFGTGGRLPVREGVLTEATFALEVNEWGGVAEPRLVLRHARPAPLAAVPMSAAPAREQQELVLFTLP